MSRRSKSKRMRESIIEKIKDLERGTETSNSKSRIDELKNLLKARRNKTTEPVRTFPHGTSHDLVTGRKGGSR